MTDISHLDEATQAKLEGFSDEEKNAYLVATGQNVSVTAQTEEGEKPEFDIPEKFKRETPEESMKAILDSYAELERKMSAPKEKPEETQDPKEVQIPKTEIEETEEETEASPDLNQIFNDMLIDGEVGKYREMLEKAGLNAETIQRFEDMAEQTRQFSVLQAADYVGGMDTYKDIIRLASKLDPTEIDEINQALKVAPKQTLLGLKARFQKDLAPPADGKEENEATVVGTDEARHASNRGFNTFSEWQEAIRDPRYKTDPSYAEMVDRRFVASKNLVQH